MFTQVYFHKTRVAYDVHLRGMMKEVLPGGKFPRPVGDELRQFLDWDDWRVLGLLNGGKGGEHGKRLAERNHYREIFHTPEVATEDDLTQLEAVKKKLGELVVAEESASKSWYKTGVPDIPVISDIDEHTVKPLSRHSSVVANLKANNQVLLYVKPENAPKAQAVVNEVMKNARSA